MKLNGDRLRTLKVSVEKEQQEVRSVREKLIRQAQKKEAKLERQKRKLLQLKQGAFQGRTKAERHDFKEMMKYIKEATKKRGGEEQQQVVSLKKHSEKLYKQEEFFNRKLGVIEKLKSEHEFSEAIQKSEREFSENDQLTILKTLSEERSESPTDTLSWQQEEPQSQEHQLQEEWSGRDFEAPHGSDEQREQREQGEQSGEASETRLTDSFYRALQWKNGQGKNGQAHGLRFSYELPGGKSVVIEVERSREKELSLVVFFPDGSSKHSLSHLRSRLATVLSSAGYSLSHIRGVA